MLAASSGSSSRANLVSVVPAPFPTSVRSGEPHHVDESDCVTSSRLSSCFATPSVLSRNPSPAPASVQATVVSSVGVFYDNIVRSRGTGIRSSCFSIDSAVLH